jgi:hypothetical protein
MFKSVEGAAFVWASCPTESVEGAAFTWASCPTESVEGAAFVWASCPTESVEGAAFVWASCPTGRRQGGIVFELLFFSDFNDRCGSDGWECKSTGERGSAGVCRWRRIGLSQSERTGTCCNNGNAHSHRVTY